MLVIFHEYQWQRPYRWSGGGLDVHGSKTHRTFRSPPVLCYRYQPGTAAHGTRLLDEKVIVGLGSNQSASIPSQRFASGPEWGEAWVELLDADILIFERRLRKGQG